MKHANTRKSNLIYEHAFTDATDDLIRIIFVYKYPHNESTKRQANKYDQVKEGQMGRACSTNRVKRYAYRVLVGKPEGKRPLGKPRRRC
jgi:hypothetical protein